MGDLAPSIESDFDQFLPVNGLIHGLPNLRFGKTLRRLVEADVGKVHARFVINPVSGVLQKRFQF